MRIYARTRISGFTLVELMVVVLVGAILIGIGVPSYQSQIRKSRRTDAKTAVLDLAGREEKYLSLNNTYSASPAALGYVASTATTTQFPLNVGSSYYQIYVCLPTTIPAGGNAAATACNTATAVAATGTNYVVSAIAVAGTSQARDSLCQYFAVDNTGTQYASSTAGIGTNTTTTCW
jgi:type IV pilus assembly protein PilE